MLFGCKSIAGATLTVNGDCFDAAVPASITSMLVRGVIGCCQCLLSRSLPLVGATANRRLLWFHRSLSFSLSHPRTNGVITIRQQAQLAYRKDSARRLHKPCCKKTSMYFCGWQCDWKLYWIWHHWLRKLPYCHLPEWELWSYNWDREFSDATALCLQRFWILVLRSLNWLRRPSLTTILELFSLKFRWWSSIWF